MSMSQPSERAAVVAVVQPVDNNGATTLTAAFDHSKFGSSLWIVQVGVIAAGGVVDFKLQSSATSNGTYADIAGKAITQLSATDDGKTVLVNLKAEELPTGEPFVKGRLLTGAGSSLNSVVALGMDPLYGPASDDDLSTVAQIVT